MASGKVETPIPAGVFARLSAATRFVITGSGPESWFGPQQPLVPQAPAEVKGRQWDYPFGVNINYVPRSDNALSFADLRALSEALPLLRAVIETRKDQISALNWTVRPRLTGARADAGARSSAARAFLTFPDRRHDFATWLRILVEDMLVIDAPCIYPRYNRGGGLYSLDILDGATIKPLIGEDGRSPEPPDPAYQQILHGVPAADFGSDELFYLPRNVRSHRLYGFSPVEQIALTINIALRRESSTLDYYNTGSVPDSFATLPKDWTVDQIRQFQDYFDALMSGNLARRRMVKFMPSEFHLIQTRQPPLKDMYDEWLARVICYAFSVPASAFVGQMNRATSETLRTQAAYEGMVPLKSWVKMMMDKVIQICFRSEDCEFAWVGDDAIDPLQQAQTISILVNAGVKTIEEARVELGLNKENGFAKYNHNHDERGRFTDAAHAVEPGSGAGSNVNSGGGGGNPVSSSNPPAHAGTGSTGILTSTLSFLGSLIATPAEAQDASETVSRPPIDDGVYRPDQDRKLPVQDVADNKVPTPPVRPRNLGNNNEETTINKPSKEIIDAVINYGKKYNVSPQLLLDIIAYETRGKFNPNEKNKESSASGLFQLTSDTWRRFGNPKGNVFNINDNVEAGAKCVAQYATELKLKTDLNDLTEEQVYLAHQQGPRGAAALIRNPDKLAVDVLQAVHGDNRDKARKIITGNGGNINMTSREFMNFLAVGFDKYRYKILTSDMPEQ